MAIQARREILGTWRAAARYSCRDGEWTWGGRHGRNSVSDARQLLTILYPATAIEALRLDSPDQIAADALESLRPLGDAAGIARRLAGMIGEYLRTYADDGIPDFSGGTCFEASDPGAMTAEQRKLPVTESFAVSVTLCLAALSFLRGYRQGARREADLREAEEAGRLCAQRLTAAMAGLLRSFTVRTFALADPPGQVILGMLSQADLPLEALVPALLRDLAQTRVRLMGLATGLGEAADGLADRDRLFECGWAWGIVRGAPGTSVAGIGREPAGVALARPSTYFTAVALDGIRGLLSERTRVLGLLDDEQQRLASALRLRFDLTAAYWTALATPSFGRWPLEDVPWVTTDGRESDYNSLLIAAIVIEGLGDRRGVTDAGRIGGVLEELANRGRVTRRPMQGDPAVGLHLPGIRLPLDGSEQVAGGGPRLEWTVSGFAPLAARLVLQLEQLAGDPAGRARFLDLADTIWAHLDRRRLESGASGLWDQPARVFTDTGREPYQAPSWSQTERVTEILVAASRLPASRPENLAEHAERLLAEADHLVSAELHRDVHDPGGRLRERLAAVSEQLWRARQLLPDRPGTAAAMAQSLLRALDMLSDSLALEPSIQYLRADAERAIAWDREPGAGPGHRIEEELPLARSGGRPPGPADSGPSRPEQRWLIADMPATVPLRAEVSLLVRIGPQPSGTAGSAALKDFAAAPGGTPVTVIVQAPRELVPAEPLEQVLVVPAAGSSEPVRFAFRADQAGLFVLRVTAFAGGTYLGELVAELSVEAGGRLTSGPTRTAAMPLVQAEPGEVTLQVRFDGERYTFQLLSESYLFEPVIASALTARPGEAVERAVATLRKMATASSGYTEKNARTWMEETGIGLWNDMVPDLIKEQFWQLRSSIASFSIACGQDTIPWELLYPLAPSQDAGFLVEQFPVLRRVYGQRRTRQVSVGQAVYVVPAGSPADARQEVAALRGRVPSAGQEVGDLAALLGLINAGTPGMLHFACHNTFRADAGGSSIVMGGEPFLPGLLNRAVTTKALAGRSPLVFINACRTAAQIPEYTRHMGWAGQFMAAGAGAFVGTLWAVRSASALTFAEAFYDALLGGHALGQAARQARQAAAADRSDPTWLAYTVYGDPAATAAGLTGPA